MTQEELRRALKLIDFEVGEMCGRKSADLRDAISELSEYLLKAHARIDRLNATVNRLVKEINK